MTIILSPDDVRKERNQSDEEAAQRTNALAAEESRLARAINLARTNADRQIKEIGDMLITYKAEVSVERTALLGEVEGLENRRIQALKPIEEIRKEAEGILHGAQLRADQVEQQAKIVAQEREKNVETAERLQEREDDHNLREKRLDRREEGIKGEEARVKLSTDQLANEWVGLHKAIHEHNQNVEAVLKRDSEIDAREKGVEIRHKELDRIQLNQNRERIAIQDGHESLRKARKEILGRDY